MKVELIYPQSEYEDIIIDITNDSGKTVTVMVPQCVFTDEYEYWDNIYGLNLVTRGHYL